MSIKFKNIKNLIIQYFITKNNRDDKKILLRYFIMYFLVLIITLVIGFLYYYKTLEIVQEDAINANMAILKQASTILDQRFIEVDSIANQVIANYTVIGFQHRQNPLDYPNTYSIIKTRDSLLNYRISNKFVWNYFVFFNKSKMVVNNEIVYTYEQFYKNYLQYRDLSYEDWYKQVSEGNMSSVLSGEKQVMVSNGSDSSSVVNLTPMTIITYTKPLISLGHNEGEVMIAINKEDIIKQLLPINTNDGGITYIQNKERNIITYSSSNKYDIKSIQDLVNKSIESGKKNLDITLGGKNMVVSYVKTNNNYLYVAIQSKRIVLARANDVKSILYLVLIISILVGTLISYYLARNNSRPLKEIYDIIQMKQNNTDISHNIFDNIKDTISELTKSNHNLASTLDAQIPLLRTTFLNRLINGDFSSQDEVEHVSKFIHLICYDRVYCIVIFRFDIDFNNYDTIDLTILYTFKQLLKSTLDKFIANALYCDPNEQQVALLMDFPSSQKDHINQYIEDSIIQINNEIPDNVFRSILISCGNVVSQLVNIPDSFEKAKLAFKIYSSNMKSNILWYSETGGYTVNYFFPADLETKLNNYVKTGDKAAVKEVLRTLFTQNIFYANLSSSLQRLFIYELLGNVIKLGNQIGMDENTYNYIINNIDKINKFSDLKQIQAVTESYYLLCDKVNDHSDKHSMHTINRVIEYINKSYLDSNISLTSIAGAFNMNESYLSYIFKQQSGIKLFSHIENLRIQKAKELLENTSLSISEISEKTGYMSSNTFCRAFKRTTGINATSYRGSNT